MNIKLRCRVGRVWLVGAALAVCVPAGIVASSGSAHAATGGGPVILDGMDPGYHGYESGGVPQGPWIYTESAYTNLMGASSYGSAGQIAVLGAADSTASAMDCGGEAHYAAAAAGYTPTFYSTSTAIDTFFNQLAAGTVSPMPRLIHIVDTACGNGLTADDISTLTAHATDIANFVNAGGALLADTENGEFIGSESLGYDWLTALLPSATIVGDQGDESPQLTPAGSAAFPGLTNDEISSPWHSGFSGNLGDLQVLATDSGFNVIIGGSSVTLPGSIDVTPSSPLASPGSSETVTATVTADSSPVDGATVSFTVTAGPNAGTTGTAMTDSSGKASFTYTGGPSTGADTISAAATVNSRLQSASTTVQWATAPTGIAAPTATGGDSSAQVTFDAPSSDGGSPVTGYTVTASPGGATASATAPGTVTVPGLTNGTSYTFAVTATNAVGMVTSMPSNAVTPAGLPAAPSIESVISGDSSATVTVTDTDANGSAVTAYNVTVSPGGPVVSGPSPLTVRGLRPGFPYSLSVTATNGVGTGPATQTADPVVVNAFPSITSPAFTGGEQAVPYSAAPVLSGGTHPLAWSTTGGAVPDGLSLDPATGALTGVPTTPGTFTFTLVATDAAGKVASQAETVTILATPAITSPALPGGEDGVTYSGAPSLAGGTPPAGWSITGGSLPDGLTLNPTTGAITGVPTTAGTYTFDLVATDADAQTATQAETVTIIAGPTVTAAPPLTGDVGAPVTASFGATGGTGPYTWAIESGALPAGITLGANGALAGAPTVAGSYSFEVLVTDGQGQTASKTVTFTVSPSALNSRLIAVTPDGHGYWIASKDGNVVAFGSAKDYGTLAGETLHAPIVGIAGSPDGHGYWLVASDGGIFTFGDAGYYGSTGAMKLNQPVVGMAASPDGRGYWLVASDGGIFTFGDAGYYGSTGAMKLNEPVVGMAASPDGRGYWLVASDGGIFTFGDAGFHGSTGAVTLNQPIVGMAATPDGRGYWLVAADGGIFTFGTSAFYGSMGNQKLNGPMDGIQATPDGHGYWTVATDGGIFAFGDAGFLGSAPGIATPFNG